MPLQLLPMPEAEWPIYTAMMMESFDDILSELWFPNGFDESDLQHIRDGMKRGVQRYPDRSHILKVVDTDLPDSDPNQKIVGISHWKIFAAERSEEEIEREKAIDEADRVNYGFKPHANVDSVKAFVKAGGEYRKKHIGRDPHVFLALLATKPGHWRRGIGAVSMKYGCAKADELGIPMYLESSPYGLGLYKKWGYEVVDELTYDKAKLGLESLPPTMCMKRPAQGKSIT